jgi:hypothetical protein
MVVFGITGGLYGCDSRGAFCFNSVAAFGSDVSLPALSPTLSGVPDVTGMATCDASDASKSVVVLPPLDGRIRLISGLIVRFSPVGSTGATGVSGAAGAAGTGVPQILQKRALVMSSLLHVEQ